MLSGFLFCFIFGTIIKVNLEFMWQQVNAKQQWISDVGFWNFVIFR
jgi:hypothetical protein